MATTSTVQANSASTPFKLLNTTFPVFRNFLDIMPLKDLHVLRKNDDTVNSFPSFRGEVVDCLYINDTDVDHLKYTSYYDLIDRPYKTTPYSVLDVEMDSRICPDVLLSKLDEKRYKQLTLGGEYTWKQVVSFLHEGVEKVELFGTMDLPQTAMKEFFNIVLSFKIKKICYYPKNRNENWPEAALKELNSVAGIEVGPWEFDEEEGKKLNVPIGNRVMEIWFDDREVDNFVGDNFGNEIDDAIWADDDVEADDNEEMDDAE